MTKRALRIVSGIATMSAALILAAGGVSVCAETPSAQVPASTVAINKTNFPDDAFREYVKKFDDGDNKLTAAERSEVTSFYGLRYVSGVADLTGIQYFENLETFYSTELLVKSIDLSANTKLKSFSCESAPNCESILWPSDLTNLGSVYLMNSKIPSIDLSGAVNLAALRVSNDDALTKVKLDGCTALKLLYLENDPKLTTLPSADLPSLESLSCHNSGFTKLDVSGYPELTGLGCSGCKFSTLDLTKNTKLTTIVCSQEWNDNASTKIKVLNITGLDALSTIKCAYNEISVLDTSNKNLYELKCSNNQIKKLDLSSSTQLSELDCSYNELTSLDFSATTNLRYMKCNYNQIETLKIPATSAVDGFECDGNKIKKLDLSKYTQLNYLTCRGNELTTLMVKGLSRLDTLHCEENALTSLDLSGCSGLKTLSCENNALKSLVLTGDAKLQKVTCYNNTLESLDVSNLTSLTTLACGGNNLKTIKLTGATALEELQCQVNSLTALNVSTNVALKRLECYQNNIGSIKVDNCPSLVTAAKGDFGMSYGYFNRVTYWDDICLYPRNSQNNSDNIILCDRKTPILAQGLTPTPTPLAKATNLKTEQLEYMYYPTVKITWDPIPGATSYKITHTDPIDGHWYGYTIIEKPEYTFYQLYPDTTYGFKVTADSSDNRYPNPFVEVHFTTEPDSKQPETDISIKQGETYQYTVRFIPGNKITWSVGNPLVATVDKDGNVTGVGIGNTYLYVGLPNGKTIKCLVRVGYPDLKINYTEKTLYPCSTFQFTTTGAAGKKITWSVGNTAVATVNTSGKVTGKSIANTYLYAKSADGRVAKCLLKVVDPGELGINYTVKTIYLGQSYTFTAKNARTFTPTWSVGNTAVAKVDASSGKVTSVSVGNTYLYAKTADGRVAKCLVKVVNPGPLNITYTEKTIKVGATFHFAAKNPAGQTVTWRVGNTAVATVDANGNVTGKKAANTWLYASTPDGREVKCLIKVVA